MRSRVEEEWLTRDVLQMPSELVFKRSARRLKIFLIGGGLAALWRFEVLLLLAPLFSGIVIGLIIVAVPMACVGAASSSNVVRWICGRFAEGELS